MLKSKLINMKTEINNSKQVIIKAHNLIYFGLFLINGIIKAPNIGIKINIVNIYSYTFYIHEIT